MLLYCLDHQPMSSKLSNLINSLFVKYSLCRYIYWFNFILFTILKISMIIAYNNKFENLLEVLQSQSTLSMWIEWMILPHSILLNVIFGKVYFWSERFSTQQWFPLVLNDPCIKIISLNTLYLTLLTHWGSNLDLIS